MNKELSDLAWSILPKEFKEEVKRLYKVTQEKSVNNSPTERYFDGGYEYAFEKLFGKHNLTTDAEGEEMLTVEKCKVQYRIQYAKDGVEENADYYNGYAQAIYDIFGSKCLPDEEPITQFKIGDKVRAKGTKQIGTIKEPYSNDIGYRVYFEDGDGGWDKEYQEDELIPYKGPKPAEPKFKVGDYVRYNGDVRKVVAITKDGKYFLQAISGSIPESDLEPYTAPEGESRNLSQETANCDKQFDNILKDSFSKERRLNIAAMAMRGILSNPYGFTLDGEDQDKTPENVAETAFLFADALIAEAEKGGSK